MPWNQEWTKQLPSPYRRGGINPLAQRRGSPIQTQVRVPPSAALLHTQDQTSDSDRCTLYIDTEGSVEHMILDCSHLLSPWHRYNTHSLEHLWKHHVEVGNLLQDGGVLQSTRTAPPHTLYSWGAITKIVASDQKKIYSRHFFIFDRQEWTDSPKKKLNPNSSAKFFYVKLIEVYRINGRALHNSPVAM